MSKKPKKRKIALVVDRSGSMSSVRAAAVSAINEQLKTIKDNAGEIPTEVNYIQFDNEIEHKFKLKAENVKEIKFEEYVPRASTSLYDAINHAIIKLQEGNDKNTSYLVIVISDGWENSSREINQRALVEKIENLEKTNQWTFAYMMSNVDLKEFNSAVSAHGGNASSWEFSEMGLVNASVNLQSATANYLSTPTMATTNFYADQITTADTKSPKKTNKNSTSKETVL